MNKKRNRSVNWDEEEKQLLRFALKEHVHIIQNKAIDTKTIKLKNKAWEEVYKKFNELNGRHRQLIQLKIQWKRMKLNAQKRRKIYSTFQREANKPDEGAEPATPIDTAIENLLNPTKLLRGNNLYESNENILDLDRTCLYDKFYQKHQQINDLLNDEANMAMQMKKRNGVIPAKNHDDCVSSMVSHMKMLKEEEHRRRLQMAEEEHSIKIAIQKEKLKSATLEREILELQKAREEKIFNP